mmetsp:Transcript_42361/g.54501  ORF Transcript_42361/g.54501 Transcript_42361/m.54501 type:complete len:127 (+) Transcript_42361:533-913(+)
MGSSRVCELRFIDIGSLIQLIPCWLDISDKNTATFDSSKSEKWYFDFIQKTLILRSFSRSTFSWNALDTIDEWQHCVPPMFKDPYFSLAKKHHPNLFKVDKITGEIKVNVVKYLSMAVGTFRYIHL